MQQVTTTTLTLDELVFIGRNQAYGAFDLHQHYRPTLSRALWLGIGLFFCSLIVSAQQTESNDEETIYTVVEHSPEFPGGFRVMQAFLAMNVHYPDSSAKNNIRGKVFVSFVVERDGNLTHINVLKGLDYWCNAEAIRLMKTMPPWIPGTQSGRAIRVKYNLPVAFGLK